MSVWVFFLSTQHMLARATQYHQPQYLCLWMWPAAPTNATQISIFATPIIPSHAASCPTNATSDQLPMLSRTQQCPILNTTQTKPSESLSVADAICTTAQRLGSCSGWRKGEITLYTYSGPFFGHSFPRPCFLHQKQNSEPRPDNCSIMAWPVMLCT